jgi:hypothetical protein
MINGVMSLKLGEVQKNHPKGKAVETEIASAYKSLGKELKAKYPESHKGSNTFGSKGVAFGG